MSGAVVVVDTDAAAPLPADLSDAEEEERAAAVPPSLELPSSDDSAAGSGEGC